MTEQTKVGASLVVDSDPVENREKAKLFLTVYRDQDFFMDITPMKLAVTLVTGQWEPTIVISYAETVADLTLEDVLEAFITKVTGDNARALSVKVDPTNWARTGFAAGMNPLDITALMRNGRELRPDLEHRFSYEDTESLVSYLASVGRETGQHFPVECGRYGDGSLFLKNPSIVPVSPTANWRTLRQITEEDGVSLRDLKREAYDRHRARKAARAEKLAALEDARKAGVAPGIPVPA
ncbi:MAG: hypothetical protein GXY82_09220 [Methanospirillum sp.]|nr:hypothetical protein [Methanospirillum sp.]